MPIRTNRGRAAVYRKLWGWPMRSPRHLVVVAVVVAVVVTAVGILVPRLTGAGGEPDGAAAALSDDPTTSGSPSQPDSQNPQDPVVTGSATELPTRITELPQTPTSAPPDTAALQVADTWARAWVDHPPGITNEQWLATLEPLTTEEYLTVMSSVEPGNIEATKVTGPPVATASYTSSVEATVPTDAGELAITVIETPEGWRVAFYEPVA